MIETKLFEVQDSATFIPVIAQMITPPQAIDDLKSRWLLSRAGFREPCIIVSRLAGGQVCYDPYDWGSRTMLNAHLYIVKHWKELKSGAVVDVQFILGETEAPKSSEMLDDLHDN